VDVAAGEVLLRWRGLSAGALEGARLLLLGLGVFLVFWYRPQALQMVLPVGDRRQRGVLVVPQLLTHVSGHSEVEQ
jgi:hypothetical protein